MQRLQMTELQLLIVLPALITMISIQFFHLMTINYFLILMSIMGIGVVAPSVIMVGSYFILRKKGIKSFYNPLIKMIEIHVGRTTSEKKMLKICLQAKRDAKKMNVDILFCTNHYPKVLFYIPFVMTTIGVPKKKPFRLLRCVWRVQS
ncbi:hypothetical protein ACFVS2_25185 [Brevibacillus sp. NPDC058079]|uniref:hypothetical protein n=1 Tax=Brevibacillus sp. NPDC058079 TaxID=3346330 RepID=UPI0036EB46B6